MGRSAEVDAKLMQVRQPAGQRLRCRVSGLIALQQAPSGARATAPAPLSELPAAKSKQRSGKSSQSLTLCRHFLSWLQLRERVAGEVKLQQQLMAVQGMLEPMLAASLAATATQQQL